MSLHKQSTVRFSCSSMVFKYGLSRKVQLQRDPFSERLGSPCRLLGSHCGAPLPSEVHCGAKALLSQGVGHRLRLVGVQARRTSTHTQRGDSLVHPISIFDTLLQSAAATAEPERIYRLAPRMMHLRTLLSVSAAAHEQNILFPSIPSWFAGFRGVCSSPVLGFMRRAIVSCRATRSLDV